jgi:hypothetical protein
MKPYPPPWHGGHRSQARAPATVAGIVLTAVTLR